MTRKAALEMMNQDRHELTREEALKQARELTASTKRHHVVRVDCGRFLVVPLYAPGAEGLRYDPGFLAMGTLVEESMTTLKADEPSNTMSYYSRVIDRALARARLLEGSREDVARLEQAKAQGWDVTKDLELARARVSAFEKP